MNAQDKQIQFYKSYMIVRYIDYYSVYRPNPNSISFPLCRVDTVDQAQTEIDKEIRRLENV